MNLPKVIEWVENIYQIETTDDVIGGENGIANSQAKALSNRTLYLKQEIEKKALSTHNHDATYAPKGGSATQKYKVADAVADDEAVNKKQMEESLSNIQNLPSGTILTLPYPSVPNKFLECNGAELSRSVYSNLFAHIGVTYGSGDGSTTFNIPDLRGEFIRGWDHGRGVDNNRQISSFQADELKRHSHDSIGSTKCNLGANYTIPYVAGNSGTFTKESGGNETRPRNIAMMYCIKY